MQFQVPQFIETEDKIIGGILTLKQFLFVAGGAGISFLFFFILSKPAWLFVTILIGGIVITVVFVKISGRPVSVVAFMALKYYWGPRFYLWSSQKAALPTPPKLQTPLRSAAPASRFEFKSHPIKTAEPVAELEEQKGPVLAPIRKIESPHPAPQTETASLLEEESPVPRVALRKDAEPTAVIPPSPARLAPELKTPTAIPPAPPMRTPAVSERAAAMRPTKPSIEPRQHEMEEASPERDLRATPEFREALGARGRTSLLESPASGRTEEPRAESLETMRERLRQRSQVQSLVDKINTTKTALPKREKKFSLFPLFKRDRFELLRKATGELEAARRIDYK